MTNSDADNEDKIIESWSQNTQPWITAINQGQIRSRKRVTNNAIINTIVSYKPNSVLDIGCGEGWLVRELASHNINAMGIDAIPALVQQAQQQGGGKFQLISYQDIAQGKLKRKFDLLVCNFSLLGKQSVEGIFTHAPMLLNQNGYFLVQTLHPEFAATDKPYQDGWRQGSWDGFSDDFSNPAPWYFRTMASWQTLFGRNRFQLLDSVQALDPETQRPASIIFIGQKQNA
jgi:2-polyprenyl-3-methyl-5-hydroxy-6-metoxy-1,4-benzoquinol methylase